MDRLRRDPAGIDLGDVFSLGPKPMKTMLDSTKVTTSQRQPPGSAAASASGQHNLGSQLEGLGGHTTGTFGSSTPAAKRPAAASGQSTYQLDPFAELSLGDKAPQHRPMASRGSSAQELVTERAPQLQPVSDDPFSGVPKAQHTASAGSAATSAGAPAAQPSPDDPFSLWGEPPPQARQHAAPRQPSGDAAIADDLLEQFTAGSRAATPPQPQPQPHARADDVFGGSSVGSPAAPHHQPTASYGSDGMDDLTGPGIWDTSAAPTASVSAVTHAVVDSYAEADRPPPAHPASPPPSVRQPSRGRPAGFDPRAVAGGFAEEGFIDESDFASSPQEGNLFGSEGAGSGHSSPRRHKRSDRGHMSIGSIGSMDPSSPPKSPRSGVSSPTAPAQPDSGSGGIFGSAYQAHQEEAQRGAPGDMREQATRYLGMGSKWIRNSATRIAKVAKEKIDELDIQAVVRPVVHHGRSSSQDASRREDVPEHYYQWAATMADMPPDQRANMLGQLPEDDRLIVQRILDTNAIASQQRQAVEEASARVHDMSPRRGVASPRQPGSAGGHSSSAGSSPRQPASRRAGGSEEGSGPASRLSRPGRPPPPAYDDLVQDGFYQPPTHQPQRSLDDGEGVSDAAAEANAAIERAKARRQAQSTAAQQQPPPRRQATPARPPAKRPAAPADADLLAVGDQTETQPAAAVAEAAPAEPNLASVDDLGDFFNAPAQPAAPTAASGATDSMDMFAARPASQTNGHAAAQQQRRQQAPSQPARPSPASGREPGKGPVLDDRAVEGEPEARRVAREKRLAAKQAAIDAARQEMQMREAASEEEKSQKVDLRDQIKPRMDAWSKGKQDNIRALLSTLHTVLWADSGWKTPGLTDLVEANKVKRCYMRANLLVHPDKVKQKGGSLEQLVTAVIAFDILKVAWGRFEEGELRGGGSRMY